MKRLIHLINSLRLWIYIKRQHYFQQTLKKKILKFAATPEGKIYQKETEFIAHHGLSIFPYPFQLKYNRAAIDLKYDEGYPYVDYRGKPLFLPKSMSENKARAYANDLLMEQDPDSPHQYANRIFSVDQNDILVDIGCGDANFSLENIDTVKKAFLFESDPKWKVPQKKTFAGSMDKVFLYNRRVGLGKNEVDLSQLSDLENQSVLFKIDVDGAEREVLKMIDPLLPKLKSVKIALCTYHQHDDASQFEKWLISRGFRTGFGNGYMLFHPDTTIKKPFFRPGIIFGLRACG